LPIKIGEIIEASTGEFTAQCYELHRPPSLGSLVRTAEGEVEIYAVVCDAATTGIEPGRRPLPRASSRGGDPLPGGGRRRRRRTSSAPARNCKNCCAPISPPLSWDIRRMKNFDTSCRRGRQEYTASSMCATMMRSRNAACLRHAARAQPNPRDFLVKAGKELAVLLGSEPNRLNAVLRRIRG